MDHWLIRLYVVWHVRNFLDKFSRSQWDRAAVGWGDIAPEQEMLITDHFVLRWAPICMLWIMNLLLGMLSIHLDLFNKLPKTVLARYADNRTVPVSELLFAESTRRAKETACWPWGRSPKTRRGVQQNVQRSQGAISTTAAGKRAGDLKAEGYVQPASGCPH